MTQYRVDELTGPLLDYAVGKLEERDHGIKIVCEQDLGAMVVSEYTVHDTWINYSPSTDWAQGGPIIARFVEYRIEHLPISYGQKQPRCYFSPIAVCVESAEGETLLIAAMRCYVKSRCGDYVDLDVQEGV